MSEHKPFHAKDRLFFEREEDGSVRITMYRGVGYGEYSEVVLDPSTWASAVAAVSPKGDTAETFSRAQTFHLEPEDEEWMNAPLGPYKEAEPLAMLEAALRDIRMWLNRGHVKRADEIAAAALKPKEATR